MASIYQGKRWVYFSELPFLKGNGNTVVFLELPKIKQRVFFIKKDTFCYAVFSSGPYFLNEVLDKVYSDQLKSCSPTNRKKNTEHSFSLCKI